MLDEFHDGNFTFNLKFRRKTDAARQRERERDKKQQNVHEMISVMLVPCIFFPVLFLLFAFLSNDKSVLTHLFEDRLRQFFTIDDLYGHPLARETVNSQLNQT